MPDNPPNNRNYDIIIVGAGSAGCALAGRLSEDKGRRVLLVEAGGWDTDPWIKIPLGWPHILLNRKHDWMYFAEPETTTGGRGLECARGRVIGGSSSINAMAYVRGNQGDYERWAASGLKTWSYAHVLPYFRRQESWKGGASFYRGGDGPLATRMAAYSDPLAEAYAAAGRAAGYTRRRPTIMARSRKVSASGRRRRRTAAAAAPPTPTCDRRWSARTSVSKPMR